MTYAKMTGVGSYLPKKVLTNHDLEKMVDTSDEWIVERSGISKRHIAGPDETSSTMGEMAAREALKNAGIQPEDLDLIIVGTCTPDQFFPSTACLIQNNLGAVNATAFDVSAACSGFIFASSTAQQFIENGAAKNVLVVGVEIISRVLDWNDRTTCVLFGDGAGAVVYSASDKPGIISSKLGADGSQKDILFLPTGVADESKTPEPVFVKMEGRDVFRHAVDRLTKAVSETLETTHLEIADIDWIVPHQANLRIIKMIAAKLKIPMEKIIVTVDEHANTSSASIPLALDAAIKDGRIKSGDKILFEAFGGGLTWGGMLVEF